MKYEIDQKILEVTAVVAGDFYPNTREIVEYTRRFGVNPGISDVNKVLQLAACITNVSPDILLSGETNPTVYLKGMRTMMPGNNAENCNKFECPLINSCAMALFAIGADSTVRKNLDPKLANITHIRI